MSNAPLILLIDGNREDREYYTQLLRISSPGFDVLRVPTGRVGLALCKQQLIDCVVLELDLDDMSGFEVLLRLIPRVLHPKIAVVILTRLANPYLLEAAINNGAQAALNKSTTSGDILVKTILTAMSTVKTDRQFHRRLITRDL
jgi:CheY-like chemotaxis protein